MTSVSPQRLSSLLRPRSVALVGASNKSIFSALAYRNLVEFGFDEHTFLVNRRGVETHGRSTVATCQEIGEPVDVAFMMVPQAGTLEALEDAAAAGIRNAVILSGGYGEAGEAGRIAQAELVAHAESLDMLLLGPNMLGFANFVDRIPVTAIHGLPSEPGPVALLSQSGASSIAMVDFASMIGVGLSYVVTLGNEAMVTAGHLIDYLVDDEHTKAIAIFLEAIRDPENFARAARRSAEAGKAIVVLKAGSSELSARTAAAHTGALVGDDATINAVFADLGIIRVDSIEDMMLTAGAAAALGRIDRPGIGVVSISGGACDIVADRAEEIGAPLPALAQHTQAALAEILPGYGTIQNPLDVTGAAVIDATIFTRAIVTMSQDPSIGVVAAINTFPWLPHDGPYVAQPVVNAIGEGMRLASVPCVYVNQVLQPVTEITRAAMATGGVPYTLPGLSQMVSALRNIGWWSDRTRALAVDQSPVAHSVPVPDVRERTGQWSEWSARGLLTGAGIDVHPAVLVHSADEAAKAAGDFGCPVALKVSSPQIQHKSDIGGVLLNVTEDSVRAAYETVAASANKVEGAEFEGVLVSPMRSGGIELLVGVVRDPQWGLILAVALGGIFVEILNDSALTPLPVSPQRAEEMLRGLRAAVVFDGVRGGASADVGAVAAVVARIGDLAVALGDELESLEVNPLRVDGTVVEALDAVVTWRAP